MEAYKRDDNDELLKTTKAYAHKVRDDRDQAKILEAALEKEFETFEKEVEVRTVPSNYAFRTLSIQFCTFNPHRHNMGKIEAWAEKSIFNLATCEGQKGVEVAADHRCGQKAVAAR